VTGSPWCFCSATNPPSSKSLADIYRAWVTGLKIPLPETPDQLLTELLPQLLTPRQYRQALSAPVWLDLARPPPDLSSAQRTDWQEASLQFLARLNEQREPLRHTLILVLSLADKVRIKELAPDLWAIRHFSLETGPWLAPAAAPVPDRPSARPEPFPLNDTEQALIQEWRRLQGKDSTDRGALLAGIRACDALLHRGQLDAAKEATAWLEATARSRLADRPEDFQALHDLSVSLNNAGDADQALGQWESARAAFTESLEIRRRILQAVGKTPQALRDLSISLEKVGRADRALGQWGSARAAFSEGLEIAQRLARPLPEYEGYKDLPGWFEHRLTELAEAWEKTRAP